MNKKAIEAEFLRVVKTSLLIVNEKEADEGQDIPLNKAAKDAEEVSE